MSVCESWCLSPGVTTRQLLQLLIGIPCSVVLTEFNHRLKMGFGLGTSDNRLPASLNSPLVGPCPLIV
jgi:hypothetical protein